MKSFVAALAALAMALFVSACTTPASDGHTDHPHGAETPVVSGQPADFNDADVTFATMMIPHHEQAVDLSEMVPTRTTNPEVIALAQTISAAQGPEIETMKVLLVQWNAGEAGGHEGHDMSSMQGMVDTATMEKLQTLNGDAFDKLWLQSMIAHHEGAIVMADAELKDGASADAKRLAQQIVTAQQAEITSMKQMLGD
ncbi:DUF305 domain-containing protein [Mycolicibacterium arenosum]|uniref:DUF305 domain-containing protein n=1 Tax=Mycolicibacterium arenosum TaxID=2952157 RepID=A0ABT1M0K2_9MYCO|nr:DUF305 domain-containing protein [Mycolicibacterium sp. CAU 1645]MCP9272390.1 DUF305 domain-containing protein [Mycolicibacterium sp. CAU 1645]